jgi:SnoaL-like domain
LVIDLRRGVRSFSPNILKEEVMTTTAAGTAPAAARGWSVEVFRRFWAKPDLAGLRAIDQICTADIVGHWPRPIGLVKGLKPYSEVIEDLLLTVPDFSLTVPESAQSGDLVFVRWIATGTAPDGRRFEANGCDRVRMRGPLVCENYVFCDHSFFDWVAERNARRR